MNESDLKLFPNEKNRTAKADHRSSLEREAQEALNHPCCEYLNCSNRMRARGILQLVEENRDLLSGRGTTLVRKELELLRDMLEDAGPGETGRCGNCGQKDQPSWWTNKDQCVRCGWPNAWEKIQYLIDKRIAALGGTQK